MIEMSYATTIETIKVWKNYFFGPRERGKACTDINGKPITFTFGNTEEKVNAEIITKIIRFEPFSVGREYKVYSGSIKKGTIGYWNFPIKIISREQIHYHNLDLELIDKALGITEEERVKLTGNYDINAEVLARCFVQFLLKTDYYYLRDNDIDPTLPYTILYVHTIKKVDKKVKKKKQRKLFPQGPPTKRIDEEKVLIELIKLSRLTPKIPITVIESTLREKLRYSSHITLKIIKNFVTQKLLIPSNRTYILNRDEITKYATEKGYELPEEKPKKRRKRRKRS